MTVLDNLGRKAESYVRQSAVPILVRDGQELRQHGTGTLLRVAAESFIVTAAHVVRQAFEADLEIGLIPSNSNGKAIPLKGLWKVTEEFRENGELNQLDLAVLRLPAPIVNLLHERVFLRMDDLALRTTDFGEDLYCVCGFPSKLSNPSIAGQSGGSLCGLTIVTTAYLGDRTNFQNYSRECHLLLNADPNHILDVDGFEKQLPTDLKGISGCAIWKLNAVGMNPDSWTADRARIAAIETATYPRLIRGTRWSGLTALLHRAYPNLRPSLEFARPSWGL